MRHLMTKKLKIGYSSRYMGKKDKSLKKWPKLLLTDKYLSEHIGDYVLVKLYLLNEAEAEMTPYELILNEIKKEVQDE